jgi:Tol biopolymer transport system component
MDHRTDVFSFGAVLFEMLTGRRAFQSDTVADILASILARDPDLDRLPANVNPKIHDLIQRCLEKDVRHRWQAMGDLRIEIESILADPHSLMGRDADDQRKPLWKRALPIATAVLVTGVITTAVFWNVLAPARVSSDNIPVRRFSMQLDYVRPVISPDGRHIAYRSGDKLWVRDLGSETSREIPGGKATGGDYSDTGYYLTWSPDSQYLVFPADNELRRVSVPQGGSAVTICSLPPGRSSGRQVGGIAWSSDGETIVFSRYGSGIYQVSAQGGSPTRLWQEDHADDIILVDTPRGRAVLYATTNMGGHALIVRTPDGGHRTIAQLGTTWPELVYSPSGYILFRRDPFEAPSVWALPFSSTTLKAEGEPFLVGRRGQGMSLAQDGTLVYLDLGRIRAQVLAWRDRTGSILSKASEGHEIIDVVRLSPDGSRAVIVGTDGGRSQLWLYDVQRFVRTRFVLGNPPESTQPVIFAFWTKRAEEIFYTVRSEPTEVFERPVDGFGQALQLAFPKGFQIAQDRTADGRYVVLGYSPKPGADTRIWLWRNGGAGNSGEAVDFSQNSEAEQAPTLSPNDRFLAYTSTISGRLEVYVRPFPEGPGRWQISSGGGSAPRWAPDGTELFFYEGNSLMKVSVSTADTFSVSLPATPLFEHPALRGTPAPFARYDVAPDGLKFLTVEFERELAQPVVRVVENWLSEFRHPVEKWKK